VKTFFFFVVGVFVNCQKEDVYKTQNWRNIWLGIGLIEERIR